MTFKQTEFKGLDTKRMEKDLSRMTKQFIKMGNNEIDAATKAKGMIEYNQHQYRVYS